MRNSNDRRSQEGQMEPEVASQSEAGRQEAGPGTVRAWPAAWNVLNAPMAVVVSVVGALCVILSIFLGQLNRMEDRLNQMGDRLERMEDRLENQIGAARVDILREVKEDIGQLEERLLLQIGGVEERLLLQITGVEERLLVQIGESEQRFLAQINRRTGEIGEQ